MPTLREFNEDPSGKKLSKLMVNAARRGFEIRYSVIKEKLRRAFPTKFYIENERSVYVHIRIPSETRPKMDYDVVMHLFDTSRDGKGSLRDWEVKFFSNCPSFVYTYAYAYNKKGLFIEFLGEKLGNVVMDNPPKVRNPKMEISWDMSIYYAVSHFLDETRFSKKFWVMKESEGEEFNPQVLASRIRDFETIMKEFGKGKSDTYSRTDIYSAIAKKTTTKIKERVVKKVESGLRSTLKGLVEHRKDSKGRIIGKSKIGPRKKRR